MVIGQEMTMIADLLQSLLFFLALAHLLGYQETNKVEP